MRNHEIILPSVMATNLTCVVFSGVKARELLQGLVTADLRKLDQQRLQPSLICQHQGRVFALGYFILRAPDILWFFTPQAHADKTQQLLAPHCQLARVTMHTQRVDCRVHASEKADNDPDALRQEASRQTIDTDMTFTLDASYHLHVVLDAAPQAQVEEIESWQLWHMRAQIPILTDTSLLQFTPNQLSLVPSDWVSLQKGCYCGQEIVARTHHLGKAKRVLGLYQLESDDIQIECGASLTERSSGQRLQILAQATTTQGHLIQTVGAPPHTDQGPLHMQLSHDSSVIDVAISPCIPVAQAVSLGAD